MAHVSWDSFKAAGHHPASGQDDLEELLRELFWPVTLWGPGDKKLVAAGDLRQCASFYGHGQTRRELHTTGCKKRGRKEVFLRAVLVPQGVGAVFLFSGRFLAKQEVVNVV